MDGHEFEKRVRALAARRGLDCRFEASKGKGSHGRLWFGTRFTTLRHRRDEIGKPLLSTMCRQLDIDIGDLYGRE